MISASELSRLLRKTTQCSIRNIVLFDKNYSPISETEVKALIKDYEKDAYIAEVWDCDDIARDFINYAKKTVKSTTKENAALFLLILRDHAEEMFVDEIAKDEYVVKYLDHRDWHIYAPNERPKWIIT